MKYMYLLKERYTSIRNRFKVHIFYFGSLFSITSSTEWWHLKITTSRKERETGRRLTWSVNQYFIRNWVTALVRLICLEHLIPPCWYISFTSHHLSAWYCINIVRRNSLLVADSLLNIPPILICFERTLILKKL